MKIKTILTLSAVTLISAANVSHAQNYFRSSSQSWTSNYDSSVDEAPRTTFSHHDSGWVPQPRRILPTQHFPTFTPRNFTPPNFTPSNFTPSYVTPSIFTPPSASFDIEDFLPFRHLLFPAPPRIEYQSGQSHFMYSNVLVGKAFLEIAKHSKGRVHITIKAWDKLSRSAKRIFLERSAADITEILTFVVEGLELSVVEKEGDIVVSLDTDADRKAPAYRPTMPKPAVRVRNTWNAPFGPPADWPAPFPTISWGSR